MKRDLDTFFSLVAHRKGNYWILDEDLRNKFNIPNKVHPLFVEPTGKETNFTWPAYEMFSVIDGQLMCTVTSCSSLPTTSKTLGIFNEEVSPQNSSDRKRSSQSSGAVSPQSSDEGVETKKKKAEKVEEEKPGGSHGHCSKMKSASQISKQKGLLLFFKPVSSDPESSAPQQGCIKRVDFILNRLTKALINHDLNDFHRVCSSAAITLPLSVIESIDNAVIRYAIEKRYYRRKRNLAGKKPTAKEDDCSKGEDPVMEIKLRKLLDKRLDDLQVPFARPLPQLPRAEEGTAIVNRQEFAECLVISEFLHTFRYFLLLKETVSAEDLGAALHSGEQGFMIITGRILVALIKAIFADHENKEEDCVYQSDLHTLPVTVGTASELCRLIYARERYSMREGRVSVVGAQGDLSSDRLIAFDVVLKEKPFYALSPLDQLTVIINLINVVVGMRSFDAYMKSVRAEIQKIVEELKTLEEKEASNRKLFHALIKESEQDGDEILTRKRRDLTESIENIVEKQLSLQKKLTELRKIKRAFRLRELGYDRFHRKFWFFDSCNKGIYVERGWWTHMKGGALSSPVKTSSLYPVMEKGRISTVEDFMNSTVSCPTGIETKDWYKIQDFALLRRVCATLLNNGSRESKLLESIRSRWGDIVASIKSISKKTKKDTGKSEVIMMREESHGIKESDSVERADASQQYGSRETNNDVKDSLYENDVKDRLNKIEVKDRLNENEVKDRSNENEMEDRLNENEVEDRSNENKVEGRLNENEVEDRLNDNEVEHRLNENEVKHRFNETEVEDRLNANEVKDSSNENDEKSEMKHECSSIDEECPAGDPESELDILKQEIVDFHAVLCESAFLTAGNRELFLAKVDSATSLTVLAEIILELVLSMPQYAFRKGPSEKTDKPFSLEKWKNEVRRTKTVSRLNLLLHVIDLKMNRSKMSVRKRCFVCRKSRHADEMVFCDVCEHAFHAYCIGNTKLGVAQSEVFTCYGCRQEDRDDGDGSISNSSTDSQNSDSESIYGDNEMADFFSELKVDERIYRSLLAVPPIRRSRKSGRSIPLSLGGIEENLHKYRSLQDLKSDLRVFLDASIRYYKDNQRKCPALLNLIEKLDL